MRTLESAPVTVSATKPVRLLVVDDHHIVRQGLIALAHDCSRDASGR